MATLSMKNIIKYYQNVKLASFLSIRWRLGRTFLLLFVSLFLLFIIYIKLYYPFDNVHPMVVSRDNRIEMNRNHLKENDLLVIYNRVPKTASTSFMGIVYELSSTNNFNVMHLNITKNSHFMTLGDQFRFVTNVTRWKERHPAMVHGHFAFINFDRFGVDGPRPLYINIIRKPLDRLVSYYYFLRNGDNFRPNLIRKKHGDNRTFDECFESNSQDCRVKNLWLQIPFFCGQDADCWRPGSRWALEEAKKNFLEHFFLVGVTELLHEFIQLLEFSLPQMFRGSLNLFEKEAKSHLRKTYNKIAPLSKTIAKIQQSRIWQMENEFYQFVFDQFNFIRNKSLTKQTLLNGQTIFIDKGQQFFFEKIRPK